MSTVLAVDGSTVSSWDLSGRPYALVRDTGTYRRGLDGTLLHRREAGPDGPRIRHRLSAAEGAAALEAARAEACAALESLPAARTAARARLETVLAMDARRLATDAARFERLVGRVAVLPPDQYLAVVVRISEGCAWNACSFCGLYRHLPFRVKAPGELARHVRTLRGFFGPALTLRRSVFLGDANALCLSRERLVPLLTIVGDAFPGLPLFSFVDAWTGRRKTVEEWREYARRGLRRVYLGLETGDPELLCWLGKPGTPDDAVALAGALHEAGVALGAIVLLGAGGERFEGAHVAKSAEVLSAMRLQRDDVVYFSELADDASLGHGRRADDAPDLRRLPPERVRAQRAAIAAALRPASSARPPRLASYDVREFVY